MSSVYLNGVFIPQEVACIPVTDRGFLFGDGVYEVIPAYGGKLFRLPHHLQRLQNSLDGIRLVNPLSTEQWETMLNTLLERNRDESRPDDDQAVYLQVTRGSAPKRDHVFPARVQPTVYATSNPIPRMDPMVERDGAAAITLADTRWQRCDIKAITLLSNVLLRQQAFDNGAAEAILIRDGLAVEGSSSNIFVVSNGTVRTPPKSERLLPGITRDLVLELADQHRIPHLEADIDETALRSADEIWITSSTREIVPVTRLDGNPVGTGRPGHIWRMMQNHYQVYKMAVREGRAA